MGAGDFWSGLGLGFGQGQQQYATQGVYGGLLNQQWITAGATAMAGTVYVSAPQRVAAKQRGPETPMEWLDRRVDEMRVVL